MSAFGAATRLLWQAFNWSTLHMLSQSARKGFGVPWFGKYGLSGWGAIEKGVRPLTQSSHNAFEALKMYERTGAIGYIFKHKQVVGGVAKKFGQDVASNVGARYILGRAAGITLGFTNVALTAMLPFELGVGAYSIAAEKTRQYKGLEFGGYFMDSQGSYTSRQRAVRAITTSQLQARSAIGNEAQLMHR